MTHMTQCWTGRGIAPETSDSGQAGLIYPRWGPNGPLVSGSSAVNSHLEWFRS